MAKPMVISAAAVANINKAKTCPVRSSNADEKVMKFMLADRKRSSTDIRITMTWRRFRNSPSKPITNNVVLKKR